MIFRQASRAGQLAQTQTAKRMVGFIWHQRGHGSSEPNKYSLASSLLNSVPSTGSLALKKFMYNLYAYIIKYTNFHAFPWHIEQYSSVFTSEKQVQCLANPESRGCLFRHLPAHSRPTPLQVSQKQQRNLESKVSKMLCHLLLNMNSPQWTTEAAVSMTDRHL
jgi:hypothetical protein